jgi:D-alanyl-D-alanine carboxypeptidase
MKTFWKTTIVLGLILLGTGYFFGFPKSFWSLLKMDSPQSKEELPSALLAVPLEQRTETSVPLPQKLVFDSFALPNAHAAYVVDASSERVLYAARAHEKRQIASLTKIMTALLLMESGKSLSDIIVVDSESINRAGTTIGCGNSGSCSYNTLLPGEEVYLRDLLKAMLMNSANDSAVLIAKHVAGTEKDFVERMNQRAKELGLIDTHFCTPNGLEPDAYETDCYSSAYDVAQIVAVALKYPLLWDIMRMENQTFFSVDGSREHHIFNTNQLLGQYGRMLGAKTGFTPLAGYSLLSVGQEGDHQVIAVLLNDPVRWDDIQTVFDWAFTNFRWL